MSIRYKLLIAFSVMVILAAAVAAYAIQVVAVSSAFVVRLYDGPLMAVNHARSAQLHFAEARSAMEKALLMREAAPPSTMKIIDDSMKQFVSDLKVVQERMSDGGAGGEIDKVQVLAEDWLKLGLNHINPPAHGLLALPLTSAVFAKANEVANAIDVVVEGASAYGFDFRSQAESSASTSRTNIVMVTIAVVIVGMLLALGIAYSFTRPIRYAM